MKSIDALNIDELHVSATEMSFSEAIAWAQFFRGFNDKLLVVIHAMSEATLPLAWAAADTKRCKLADCSVWFVNKANDTKGTISPTTKTVLNQFSDRYGVPDGIKKLIENSYAQGCFSNIFGYRRDQFRDGKPGF